MNPPKGTRIGDNVARVDARDKVTGRARFPSDMPVAHPAFAVLLTSTIARGTIVRIDRSRTLALAGVKLILTYEDMAGIMKLEPSRAGGSTNTVVSADVQHFGQIVGLVVAESLEIAREAAATVVIAYDEEHPSASLASDGATIVAVSAIEPKHEDPRKGDADAAIAAARWQVDAEYFTPAQHHNAMELFTTTCVWDGDHLTVHEPTQYVMPRAWLAECLGIPDKNIRVISRYCGGGFGGKRSCSARTVLVATAARRLGRAVKLVVERSQGFTVNTYRAETRHRVKIGADADGKFLGLVHEGWELTSRPSTYNLSGTETTARMYDWPTVRTKTSIVHTDRNTPGFMRCPHELPYLFALECAVDEIAHLASMDPIDLRCRNDTQVDPLDGRPYSSRELVACLQKGSASFGWHDRPKVPGSVRDGDWRIGYGVAAAAYPANTGSSTARVTLWRDGRAKVETAFQEIGNGAYTVIAQTAAAALGLSIERVEVVLGDSALPPSTMASASNGSASVCNAVDDACRQIRLRLATAMTGAGAPFAGSDPKGIVLRDGLVRDARRTSPLVAAVDRLGGMTEALGIYVPPGIAAGAIERLARGIPQIIGGVHDRAKVMYGFGAQFVEVRIHARTGQIVVVRAHGVYSAGRIISARTAHSQFTGGMIWGIGSALFEETLVDPASARYINTNLAEYLVATHLDVGEIVAEVLDEADGDVNPMGIKGIGELGLSGMNAAVANAVFNATGKRIRRLPIRPRDLT